MIEQESTIFIVDDDASARRGLTRLIRAAGFRAESFGSAREFLASQGRDGPGCLVLDVKMPEMDGIEVLRRIKKAYPHVEVIILTGHGSDEDCQTCMELGAFAYLQKPVDIEALSETLRKANEKARGSAETAGSPEDDVT